ncbi:hypothetical protein [Nonomuraea sp. NPDC003201]
MAVVRGGLRGVLGGGQVEQDHGVVPGRAGLGVVGDQAVAGVTSSCMDW